MQLPMLRIDCIALAEIIRGAGRLMMPIVLVMCVDCSSSFENDRRRFMPRGSVTGTSGRT